MYDLEFYVGDPYPPLLSDEDQSEAMEYYHEEKIRINLTRIWQLADEEYRHFLLELIGVIIHEFLHYFFYTSEMFQENTEEKVGKLARYLKMLSVGSLIGVESKVRKYLSKNSQLSIDPMFSG